MAQAAKATRQNRTITVDFHDEATYSQLLGDTKAFIECVLAFLLSLGFQLTHQSTCDGGGSLTRHSHYARVRLGGLTIWRVQCTRCKAVFTVLPHFVLRYRQMRPEAARDALLATHGGLSLELCAVIAHISPMALYRLICAWRCFKPVDLLPSRSQREPSTRVREAMIIQVLHCPYCQGSDIVKHGLSPEGKQRYRCRACLEGRGRTFLLAYSYAGQSPEVKQQIVDMAMNASGIRDTARVARQPHHGHQGIKKKHLTSNR